MSFSWVNKVNGVDDILAEDINAIANEVVALSENAGGGGGGFRKIGFTEDCDFVATESDGLTAFKDALNAATDGETFFVMSGVYKGADTLTIAKSLNFIGVGMPTIEFPISVYGEGEFDFDTDDIITPIVTYATNWAGIHFTNSVTGFQSQNYKSPLAYSAVNSENCIFEGLRNRFVGNHFQSKLIFEDTIEHNNISLGSGFEPAEGCVFESCDLIFRNFFTDFIKAENCNISFEMRNNYTAECSYIFKNCNVYNYGEIVLTNGQYLETFVVENCNVFGAKFFSEATASGNYLFSGTAL